MATTLSPPAQQRGARPVRRYGVSLTLFGLAALGWLWSARMADDMRGQNMQSMHMSSTAVMGAAGFMVAWLAMMAAMMLPAITPVVKLYARAAAQGRVAALPFFVSGYMAIWTLAGLPAYVAWRALSGPLAEHSAWAARLAGGVLVSAGLWQFTGLKERCLSHCRSPMSFFLRQGRHLERPLGAVRMGASHGFFCLGCCWAMFAVLVALGTMNLAWMLALTGLIVAEKMFPAGKRVAVVAGIVLAALGAVALLWPITITWVS